MSYCIGLDCGITSVGYSVLELDKDEEPCRIICLGSRVFPAAENPKTGASLAAPRREARSQRRRLRRHRHRNERIRILIVDTGILSGEELSHLFDGQLQNIYELRTAALDRKVTSCEFARILINLSQRRGFKSNRKVDMEDKEAGKLLSAVDENIKLMKSIGYRTVGEMLYKDQKFADSKRNKGESYANTVSRDMIESEIKQIFASQRALGLTCATAAVEATYISIVMSQRSFEEGPGGNSKYGGDQIDKMIGCCALIPDQKRVVKAAYSFQLFSLWQSINNIRIVSSGNSRKLTDEERKKIANLAHEVAALKYSKLRKELDLKSDEFFSTISYGRKEADEIEGKTKFEYLSSYHAIRKALDKVVKGRIKSLTTAQLNEIGRILTIYKNDDKIETALIDAGIDRADIDQLIKLPAFKKVGHISVEACDKLLPFLKQGHSYSEACDAAGFKFKGHNAQKTLYLPGYSTELDDLKNPVVRRAVSQTIKVINAIVREQNESPMFINIELAREMSKDFDERNKLKKDMEQNREINERIKQRIETEFHKSNPTGMDIVKLKLWEEQDGICPYSLKKIEVAKLFDVGYVDIDHIVPYSICFDDSYKNKVLVLSSENRQKGNRLPMQYLRGKQRDDFVVWVNNNIRNFKKRQNLLKEVIADSNEFKERNLQDTKYLSSFLYNYVNDYLSFADSAKGRKKRVTSVNGSVTSYMRKRWGIPKIREDGDLHHAADATVVACVTDGLIKKVSRYSQYREVEYCDDADHSVIVSKSTGEVFDEFPQPWPGFRKELEIRLSSDPQSILSEMYLPNYSLEQQSTVKPCFVSRMPMRKTKGAAHADTVRSPKMIESGYVVSKVPLTSLKLKDGEIEGYYNPSSDRLLYNALLKRLIDNDGKAEKAFGGSEPFRKPTSSGAPGPIVKKVKRCEKSSLAVPIHNGTGVAANDTMVRIDVFHVEGDGYYFVPIYVADTIKDSLPNKAVVSGGRDWKEMNEQDFVFSLYQNDVVKITTNKKIKMTLINEKSTLPKEHFSSEELLYFSVADIHTASIVLINHDKTYKARGVGIKTLTLIEKYEVDLLGDCRMVGNEKRRGFGTP